eukprot:106853_1
MALLNAVLILLLSVVYSQNAQVSIDWSTVIATSKTTTTLQVVVNALLTRQSPIHDQTFKSLSNLNANFVRFVPWFPYAKLGVAQLYPPSDENLCAHLTGLGNANNWTVSLTCPKTSTIKTIDFASWGTPSGTCGQFKIGSCHANTSMSVSKSLCLNKHSCTIRADTDTFGGDPCYGTVKQFDIQVTCSIPYNYSNWDFSLINPLMEDLMNSVNPKNEPNKTVINFSTIPNWKYSGVTYGEGLVDSPYDCSWSYNAGTTLIDTTAATLGQYYGNLVSYYKNGGFTDLYGNNITSNYNFNIDTWEILNEVESEHHNSPQSYTKIYDAIVSGIQSIADPKKEIKFMGMALAYHNEWNWYNYFLNHSNHKPDIPIDYISFHFYASSSSRTDPNAYQAFFPSVDTFVKEVRNITAIRDKLSPNTKFDIDEIGVILPGDNSNAPDPPAIYWNSAAAMFAYLFPHMVIEGVDIIGQSQLMGYPPLPQSEFPDSPGGIPPQFASVTEIDWETGVGNARYWLLKLLIDNFKIGDKLVKTTFTENSLFYAQGFMSVNSGVKKVLIVNKVNQNVTVIFNGMKGGKMYVIDEESGNGPAYVWNMYDNIFEMRRYAVGLYYPSD